MELKEQKVNELRNSFAEVVEQLEVWSKSCRPLHVVELDLFRSLLALGRNLLSYYIYMVTQLVELKGVGPDSQGRKLRHTGKERRIYRSIYGLLSISRPKYYSKTDKVVYVLDRELGLPQGRYSYVLTEWLAYGATDLDFDQSAKLLERILDQQLEGMQARRSVDALSSQVEAFYEQKDWDQVADQEGAYLCLGVDGKGVPIARQDRDGQHLSTAARLGKGRRKGIKKEATVCLSSSFNSKSRDAQAIISALFKKAEPDPHRAQTGDDHFHLQKHLRAFMANKVGGIEYGVEQLIRRDSSGEKPIIALMDGEPVLRNQVMEAIQNKGLAPRLKACILDFIHVLEKVWRVANAYKGEKHPQRQEWVEQQARLLLNSQTQEVIQQWKAILQQDQYTKTQTKHIQDGISYFEKRIDMMDYKTFLEHGYPITTGAVESACGHLVKGRMERNGMHWTKLGAQKILDLRAVSKNGDWDAYIHTFIASQQKQLYKTAA